MASAVTGTPAALAERTSSTVPLVADVLEMETASGQLGEPDVARSLDLLGGGGPAGHAEASRDDALVHDAAADERLVLAVAHHGDAERLGVVHHEAHHARVLHAAAVVGDRDGTLGDHVADLGERLALRGRRAGTDGEHPHHALLGGALDDEAHRGALVGHTGSVFGIAAIAVKPP